MRFIKSYTVFILFVIFLSSNGLANDPITIVPYPREVKLFNGFLHLNKHFRIGFKSKDLEPIAELLKSDFFTIYQFNVNDKGGVSKVILEIDEGLSEEEYQIKINKEGIVIKGGTYGAVNFGATSILQMAKPSGEILSFPFCTIKDIPTSSYRGVMLDVARQWHNIETIKQVVELCRWYKIRYMQIHLTDDQSFTFPSTTYPKLASKDRHYSVEELKNLVDYADIRGVTIIPEFDAPGHTTEMRKAMPEVFGPPSLGVIDMTKDEVYQAMEIIIGEMIDIFHSSPYFHIGGDEAWLGEFDKKATTKDYILKNDFDDSHDIYLDFLVKMHDIVKKKNKKTLIWESFSEDGSKKVKIPKDMIVFAWETAYQRPESLLENGYKIINASWKPAYVTPGFRWSSKYIYNWNLYRWENHWEVTPAYLKPIQLNESRSIYGGQMCSWEMSEEEQISSLRNRVAAISEIFWNGDKKQDYIEYAKRQTIVDELFGNLIFPVSITKEGFTEPNYRGIYFNRENNFAGRATVFFKPNLKNTRITYTVDGSMPTEKSATLPKQLELINDFSAKIGVFNKQSELIGYKLVKYEVNAIKATVVGDTIPLRDINTKKNRVEFIDKVRLKLMPLIDGVELRYTTDGSKPTINSKLYEGYIQIDDSLSMNVACFYKDQIYGKIYHNKFVKKNLTESKRTEQDRF
ncbi:family 20 glycosylhydrolase [Joostella atrarenae]|uniref:beta-N-acetylhexosaminidase n=1 Tax=Joostella atrarenae TaxID=679257 RepID=A0ABS9J525_9FLAO|nr:family 20 glycosylhydrolase [Joostella atrarenae]MCF8715522.1 family 20 glycosylhydrolase [Joostella atrarenae]